MKNFSSSQGVRPRIMLQTIEIFRNDGNYKVFNHNYSILQVIFRRGLGAVNLGLMILRNDKHHPFNTTKEIRR